MSENPLRHMRNDMGLTKTAMAAKLGASLRGYHDAENADEPRLLWVLAVRYLYKEHQRDVRAGIIAEAA